MAQCYNTGFFNDCLLYVQIFVELSLLLDKFRAYNKHMEKRQRGRPPKEPGEVLDERLYVRLTTEEKELLEHAAESQDKPLSAWIREKLVSSAKRTLSGK